MVKYITYVVCCVTMTNDSLYFKYNNTANWFNIYHEKQHKIQFEYTIYIITSYIY